MLTVRKIVELGQNPNRTELLGPISVFACLWDTEQPTPKKIKKISKQIKMAKTMEKLNMIKDLALVGKKKISLKMKKAIKRVHYQRVKNKIVNTIFTIRTKI